MRVAVPVADLRKEPVKAGATLEQDPLEESQLLYGDPVRVLEENGDWVRVAAVEQQEWSHSQRWEGYPGWMERAALASEPQGWRPNLVVAAKIGCVLEKPEETAPIRLRLSLGTRLNGAKPHRPVPGTEDWWRLDLLDGTTGWIRSEEASSLKDLILLREEPEKWRAHLVETARAFLGDPYYWGGRSAHDPAAANPPQTAVDCSGLVGLVYQANGLIIPRDAHELWMQALPLSPEELRLGDLIFLHDPQNPERVAHVMLVSRKTESPLVEENWVIEGPGTGETVREISLRLKLQEAKSRRISFGSYLP